MELKWEDPLRIKLTWGEMRDLGITWGEFGELSLNDLIKLAVDKLDRFKAADIPDETITSDMLAKVDQILHELQTLRNEPSKPAASESRTKRWIESIFLGLITNAAFYAATNPEEIKRLLLHVVQFINQILAP